jgi:hypothetical protein
MRGASAAAPATLRSSILDLHRGAGNRAVAGLLRPPQLAVQRTVGWTDASTKGRAWNADERSVGKVRRIPLEGLSEGLGANRTDEKAQVWVWDDATHKSGKFVLESTRIKSLSSESAKGKAIVLVPDALDATQPIEVLVFLHGFTEHAGRPYAGWRTLTDSAPSADPLKRLRQGVDPAELPGVPDVAPVRDVALDQAEQQLEESGQKQLVIVLPQGGLHSQFGKDGDQNFDAGRFVAQVVSRLQAEKRWKDAKGKVATSAPAVSRIDMGGHSGAGAALSKMAGQAVKPTAGAKSSPLTGDLVLYDAINGDSQLASFVQWATRRLDEDLAVLTSSKPDADKFKHLQTAPKLRGYTTDAYISVYIELDKAINRWFASHASKLGTWAPCLRANYALEYVDVLHEELMRGSVAGTKRAAGTGTILDAITRLHPALLASTTACPAIPKPLADRYGEYQQKKQAAAKAKAREGRARGGRSTVARAIRTFF